MKKGETVQERAEMQKETQESKYILTTAKGLEKQGERLQTDQRPLPQNR